MNQTFAFVLRATLETVGYTIEQAADGLAALHRIAAGGVDLVILDLNMPVLDGMSVIEQLHERLGDKPRVIVLTAHGSIASAVKAVRLGASDFLQKPVLPDDLRLSVSAVLEEPSPSLLPGDAHITNVSQVLSEVRRAIRQKDIRHAEQMMGQEAEKAAADPAYYKPARRDPRRRR